MKRLDYEAPTMEEIVVEMEEGFMTGSQQDSTNDSAVTINEGKGHEGGEDIGFGDQTW